MIRLAISGVGNIGKVHVANLLSLRGCRLAGVFDTDRRQLEDVAAEYGLRAYVSEDELLQDSDIDAVVVATPSDSHANICCRALKNGKHVFVEKPLAGTLEDARRILDAAKKSDRTVQVGFCERFNVNYLEAKRAATSGELGRIRAIHTSRLAPYSFSNPKWELGVLDTAVHNLDLILWIMQRPPVSVLARGVQVYPDSPIPHSVTILLSFEDESMAVEHIAWVQDDAHPLHHCARSRMLIQAERGIFEVDLRGRPSSILTGDGFRMIDSVIIGAAEYSGCLKLQFEYFLRALEEGLPVLATVDDALLAERVAMAALESLRSGVEVRLA